MSAIDALFLEAFRDQPIVEVAGRRSFVIAEDTLYDIFSRSLRVIARMTEQRDRRRLMEVTSRGRN